MTDRRRAPASPYPSNIVVSGLGGTISTMTVTITGYHRTLRHDDMDMLLVGPNTTRDPPVVRRRREHRRPGTLTITLSDAAAGYLPDAGPLASGTFKPTNEGTPQDAFAAGAPNAGAHGNPGGATVGAGPDSLASKFGGLSPNGTWSLYAVDDAFGAPPPPETGSITSWSVNSPARPASRSGPSRLGSSETR